jgi:hypothetical protein
MTPFHIDRENNFWLQIRGRKTLTLWDHRDRSVVPAEAVERFILFGDLDDVRLPPRTPWSAAAGSTAARATAPTSRARRHT